jgi:hypothetical protein
MRIHSGRLRICVTLAVALVLLSSAPLLAQLETTGVSLPPSLTFFVSDVAMSTVAAESATRISFSNAILLPLRVLRVSVRADAPSFSPPAGAPIDASAVTWTTTNAQNGTGVNGTLSSSSDAIVFQSQMGALSGRVDLNWSLAPVTSVRAGAHSLVLRWKIESVTP